jgi:hypothetical protein
LPTRLTALLLALGLTGCALATRHGFSEPIPEHDQGPYSPRVLPITHSTYHLFGILIPLLPLYSHPSPLMVGLSFPADLDSCPPIRIGKGPRQEILQATSIGYRSCHYSCEDRAPDWLEVDWAGRTLRTGFRRDVDWSYQLILLPTH